MSLARVQFFSVSLDGFGTGEGLSLDAPFGHAGERLHEWMFETQWGRQMIGRPGGTRGVDDAFLRLHDVALTPVPGRAGAPRIAVRVDGRLSDDPIHLVEVQKREG